MDLSFSRTLELKALDAKALAAAGLTQLPILLAATAARQAASPTCRALALHLRGQDGEADQIQALAHIFAPRHFGAIDASCLAGSFHAGVAERRTTMTPVGTAR